MEEHNRKRKENANSHVSSKNSDYRHSQHGLPTKNRWTYLSRKMKETYQNPWPLYNKKLMVEKIKTPQQTHYYQTKEKKWKRNNKKKTNFHKTRYRLKITHHQKIEVLRLAELGLMTKVPCDKNETATSRKKGYL